MSPTQRTLQQLRPHVLDITVAERWNAHAQIRQDLFGIVDVVALMEKRTLGLQCSSESDVAKHLKAIQQNKHLENLIFAGWEVLVIAWSKVKPFPTSRVRWRARIVRVFDRNHSGEMTFKELLETP